MHISDMLRQYNRNVSNGTEELRSAQGAQKLVSTIGDLSAGSVFEGTVNALKGGKVTLALGNGQVLTARLESKVEMKPGTAMFFQVKSNDGSTLSIRPYSGGGSIGNPILLGALTAAQVPVTDRTLTMVDVMMQEQMPVDRQSILAMVKLLNANPEANVQTIVQMTKLGLPVTERMAEQFEHYLSDHHALLNEVELAAGQIAETLGDAALQPEQAAALYNKVLDIFGEIPPKNGQMADTEAETSVASGMQPSDVVQSMQAEAADTMQQGMGHAASGGVSLGSLLTEEQLQTLAGMLKDIPALAEHPVLFFGGNENEIFVDTMQEDVVSLSGKPEEAVFTEHVPAGGMPVGGMLQADMSVSEFLHVLRRALAAQEPADLAGVSRLFAGKEFQKLLCSRIEEQFLLRPQEVQEDMRISKLYEKLERQMAQTEAAMKAVGMTQSSFLQTAAEIRGNLAFMNQMNQIYNYVQLPLKMMGQNANGELYVYRNKKQSNDPEAELTAFLHLAMENLGETDVSVRMLGRQVKTNFYFEDDASYRLVEQHLPILEKHLKSKGYHSTVTITNEKRHVNFKENFVKKGKASVGSVHRYSFDVRA